MRHISNNKELQERIEFLENRTKEQKEKMKVLLQDTYESIKPQNLIKNAFSDAVAVPQVRNNMLNSAVGLVTGIITNRLLIGSSAGIFKRIAGRAIQAGITKIVADKFPVIKEKAQGLIEKMSSGRKAQLDESN
jgi:ABC-type dipeptide/oligopeptide/nickel transport system ATPase subunit